MGRQNLDKEVLKKAESFDKDKLPLTHEELYNEYSYDGYKPYWQTVGAVKTASDKKSSTVNASDIQTFT